MKWPLRRERCAYCGKRLRPDEAYPVGKGVVLCADDARRLFGPGST